MSSRTCVDKFATLRPFPADGRRVRGARGRVTTPCGEIVLGPRCRRPVPPIGPLPAAAPSWTGCRTPGRRRSPASRSSWLSSRADAPVARVDHECVEPTAELRSAVDKTPSASHASRTRSIPAPKPTPDTSDPPSARPAPVAATPADAVRAVRRAELEGRAHVVVETSNKEVVLARRAIPSRSSPSRTVAKWARQSSHSKSREPRRSLDARCGTRAACSRGSGAGSRTTGLRCSGQSSSSCSARYAARLSR